MESLELILAIGLISGVLGGMGMGGGTLLIPLITIFAGVEQHLAQSINLLAFVPMALSALIVHTKANLVDYKCALKFAVPSLIAAIAASSGARYASGIALKISFGIFLIVLGIYQMVKAIKSAKQFVPTPLIHS